MNACGVQFTPSRRRGITWYDADLESRRMRSLSPESPSPPARLKVGRVGGAHAAHLAASLVKQKIVYVDGHEKTNTCIELLKAVPCKTIVFVNTKRAADTLEMDLSDLGCPAASVHGDTEQRNPRPRPH